MTTTLDTPRRGGTMRTVRSRGALSGFLVLVLGIWGALIPFVGPYFDYAYSPSTAWTWTSGRFWLEVLPGIAAVVAGFLLMTTANRSVGVFAGWLAGLSGAWFVVGPVLGRLWDGAEGAAGTPVGGTARQVWEQIGFFTGLGAVILFLGAVALGRFTVTSLRDLRAAERARATAPAAAVPATTTAPRTAPAAAAPTAPTAQSTTFRDNRVEETRVVKEPVGARAGRSEGAEQAADTTRPVETARTESTRTETAGTVGAHSEEARGEGLMGRMRHRVRGDRSTAGSTRDDALDGRRD